MTVFVDTSAILAVLDDDDREHHHAVGIWAALGAARRSVTTTSYVILETLTLARARLGADVAQRTQRDMLAVVSVIWVDEALHHEGLGAWLASGPSKVSLTDRVSFAAMRRAGIGTAFAFDRDFATAGFQVLRMPGPVAG